MFGQEKWKNLGFEILWYAVLLAGGGAICYMIMIQFAPIGEPESVAHFLSGIAWMILTVFILSFIWWRVANIKIEMLAFLRKSLENHSFLWSIIFIVLAFTVSLVVYLFHGHYINNADMRHRYSLSCIFVLPFLFAGLTYAFPPLQISHVILPGKHSHILRFVLSAFLFFAACYQFAGNFFL